jgi:hypothetical protein
LASRHACSSSRSSSMSRRAPGIRQPRARPAPAPPPPRSPPRSAPARSRSTPCPPPRQHPRHPAICRISSFPSPSEREGPSVGELSRPRMRTSRRPHTPLLPREEIRRHLRPQRSRSPPAPSPDRHRPQPQPPATTQPARAIPPRIRSAIGSTSADHSARFASVIGVVESPAARAASAHPERRARVPALPPL